MTIRLAAGLLLLLGLSAVAFLLTRDPSPDDLRRVTIAQSGDFFLYAPLYVAQDAGLFVANGLDVRVVSTGGDDKSWAAVISGSADFGVADPTFVAVSAARGAPGKVVASIVNGVPFWGITFDSAIASRVMTPSGPDLTGVSVATFPAPSTAYALQQRLFTSLGLAPDIRQGAFGSLVPMLRAGAADVALELEPNVSQAVADGADVVYSMSDLYGDFAVTGLTADATSLNDTSLVRAVTCSIQQALDFIRLYPDSTTSLLANRFPEVDPSVAAAALDRVIASNIIPETTVIHPDAWQAAISLRQELGDLSADVPPPTEFLDMASAEWAATTCRLARP